MLSLCTSQDLPTILFIQFLCIVSLPNKCLPSLPNVVPKLCTRGCNDWHLLSTRKWPSSTSGTKNLFSHDSPLAFPPTMLNGCHVGCTCHSYRLNITRCVVCLTKLCNFLHSVKQLVAFTAQVDLACCAFEYL